MKEVLDVAGRAEAEKKALEFGCTHQLMDWVHRDDVYQLLKHYHRILRDKSRKAIVIRDTTAPFDRQITLFVNQIA